MEIFARLGTFFFDLVGPLTIGYFLHRNKLISDQTNQILMKINIRVLVTVLAWLSFWILPLRFDVLFVPAFGFFTLIAPFFLAYIFFAKYYPNPFDRGAFLLSASLSGVGKVGGLVIFILFGEIGFAYVQIMSTIHNMMTLLAVFPLANFYQRLCENKASKKKIRIHFLDLFLTWNQIGLVGMTAGLLLQLCGVERPAVLGDLFKSLMHISVWISLIPVGYLIDFEQMRRWFKKSIPVLSVHFLLLPAATMVLANTFVEDEIIRGVILVVATTPAAINSVIATKLYKLNVDFTIAGYMLSSVVHAFIVVPILFWWLH